MMDFKELPYYAPAEALPSKLPSKDAVESATEILCEQSARKIVAVGLHFIVKYGLQINLGEGQTMLFLQKYVNASIPRIYALFKDSDTGTSYIIMERVRGDRLDSIWSHLDDEKKQDVSNQLKVIFGELREISSPGGYCSLHQQPLRDHIFYTGIEEVSQHLEGPFGNESELNDALIRKYLASGYLPMAKADYYRRAFPSVLTGHPPTFTHGDFQRKNMIRNPESGRITIIDWEFAGWYPSYWEYSRAIFACGRFEDDWSLWVDLSLDTFRNEWAWMQMLILELWS